MIKFLAVAIASACLGVVLGSASQHAAAGAINGRMGVIALTKGESVTIMGELVGGEGGHVRFAPGTDIEGPVTITMPGGITIVGPKL